MIFFNKKYFFVLLFILCYSTTASATTFYVSPTGDPLADGITAPTTLENAVRLAQDRDTIKLSTGIFSVNRVLRLEHGITIEGNDGRPYSTIECLVSTCFEVNVLGDISLRLTRLFFTQPNPDPNINNVGISLINGDLKLSRVTFQNMDIAISDTYFDQNAQLSVYKCRFHQIQSYGIILSAGAYLKSVSQSKFFGASSQTDISPYVTGILYHGSLNSYAQQNQYETVIQENLFKSFRDSPAHAITLNDLSGVNRVLIKENTIKDITTDGSYAMSAIHALYPAQHIGSELRIIHNTFDTVYGAAISTLQPGNTLIVIDSNDIRHVTDGISITSPAGNPNQPVKITNNLIYDYRLFRPGYFTISRGIWLSDNPLTPARTIYAEVAYNTIVSLGLDDDTLNPNWWQGAAIQVNLSEYEVLIANNILHLEGSCQDRCAGLFIDDSNTPVFYPPIGLSYGANSIHGFTLNGADGNLIIDSRIAGYVHDLGGNNNVVAPFVDAANGDFDLSAALLADSSFFQLVHDIDGQLRGQNPDRGAYQH